MDRPRLIYYNDAHHFNAKRIEPPASRHMLQWPADEVAGTGVDLLVLGLGYGDVFFHQTKIGRVVGQMKEVWDNFIDWRIMRMVEAAAEKGTDQLREVVARGRELDLKVFPSLKLQDSSLPGSERCGSLKLEHGEAVCIGQEGRAKWCYDYADERVREYELALLREVLEEYRADGVELDFMFDKYFFKASQVEEHTPLMNRFVAQVRELAQEVGGRQEREIPVMVRVDLEREANLSMGLDVEAWIADGSVDYVVAQDGRVVLQTDPMPDWLPKAADPAGVAAYYRPPRRIYDERVGLPSIEMYRALGTTLRRQGFAGQYHGYFPWPFAEREYRILRELGHPEVFARYEKRYTLQPREGALDGPTSTPERQLPVALEEGRTHKVAITVADDLTGAREDGEMRRPILTLRFAFFCIEDDIEFRINGRPLPWEQAEISDERALTIPLKLAGSMQLQAPLGMSAHWFRYRLELDDLLEGENVVEIECRRFDPKAGFARSLNGLEIKTRYRDFLRPEGLDMERLAPPSG